MTAKTRRFKLTVHRSYLGEAMKTTTERFGARPLGLSSPVGMRTAPEKSLPKGTLKTLPEDHVFIGFPAQTDGIEEEVKLFGRGLGLADAPYKNGSGVLGYILPMDYANQIESWAGSWGGGIVLETEGPYTPLGGRKKEARKRKTESALTRRDMRQGTKISRKQHPEWGTFVVQRPAPGVSDTWEIRGNRGVRVLHGGELSAWKLAGRGESKGKSETRYEVSTRFHPKFSGPHDSGGPTLVDASNPDDAARKAAKGLYSGANVSKQGGVQTAQTFKGTERSQKYVVQSGGQTVGWVEVTLPKKESKKRRKTESALDSQISTDDIWGAFEACCEAGFGDKAEKALSQYHARDRARVSTLDELARTRLLSTLREITKEAEAKKSPSEPHPVADPDDLADPEDRDEPGTDDEEPEEESLEENVAKTILQQLGGNKFIAMTGAKDLMDTGKGLQFKIGKNSGRVNKVRIELKASDTYDVEFWKIRGMDAKKVKSFSGVYADQLQPIFTKVTGMHTSLGTMGRESAKKESEIDTPQKAIEYIKNQPDCLACTFSTVGGKTMVREHPSAPLQDPVAFANGLLRNATRSATTAVEGVDEIFGAAGGISHGDRIEWEGPHGILRGKAVMVAKGHIGWVVNMGGKHGTPGVATWDRITKVNGKPYRGPRESLAVFREAMKKGVKIEGVYVSPTSASLIIHLHEVLRGDCKAKFEALSPKKMLKTAWSCVDEGKIWPEIDGETAEEILKEADTDLLRGSLRQLRNPKVRRFAAQFAKFSKGGRQRPLSKEFGITPHQGHSAVLDLAHEMADPKEGEGPKEKLHPKMIANMNKWKKRSKGGDKDPSDADKDETHDEKMTQRLRRQAERQGVFADLKPGSTVPADAVHGLPATGFLLGEDRKVEKKAKIESLPSPKVGKWIVMGLSEDGRSATLATSPRARRVFVVRLPNAVEKATQRPSESREGSPDPDDPDALFEEYKRVFGASGEREGDGSSEVVKAKVNESGEVEAEESILSLARKKFGKKTESQSTLEGEGLPPSTTSTQDADADAAYAALQAEESAQEA